MKKFLLFDFLVTTWVIRLIYWILQSAIIVFSIAAMSGSFENTNLFSNYSGIGPGIFILIFGSLSFRLIMEILIVPFKITENLQNLLEKNTKMHRYIEAFELGNLSGYKGKKEEAIDHYIDALYFLENDYLQADESSGEYRERMNLIEDIKRRLEKLRKE